MSQTPVRFAGILGVGSYVPETILSNDELAARIDTNDEWIVSRTGIQERRIASATQATSDLAILAARRALEHSQTEPDELDLIVVATCTPDHPGSFPSTASIVQAQLGACNAAAFDVGAVCAGFAYAMHIAAQMVLSGANRRVLVIGAETLSSIVNWDDRNTAVLFGDGAGAAVIGPVSRGGYLGGYLGADGNGGPLLNVTKGCPRRPSTSSDCSEPRNTISQNGKEVYKFAVSIMGEAALKAMSSVGKLPEEIDWFVPHQANIRIIAKAAERIGMPLSKVFVNLQKYGNTSAASIPIALDELARSGNLTSDQIVVLVGFGAGLTWGANVIQWNPEAKI